jgi:excisionase family DNA binding protein
MAHPINEAAELLAVDRRTVYRMLARGELRAVRVGARQRIPADELARLTRPAEAAA